MKAFLLGSVAAIGLALGVVPQQASAYWAYRPVTRFDPACGHYVTCHERCWVADPCRPAPYHVRHRVRVHRHVERHHSGPWYPGCGR
jgi:hypothetical protein